LQNSRNDMRMKTLLRVVVLVTLQTALAFGDDENPTIDPSEHRATIRQRLLEWTPLGESFSNVTTVLNEKSASPDKTPALDVKIVPSVGDPHVFVKTIRIDFGQYLTSPLTLNLPIPLPIIAETSATWFFDDKDRLTEVTVSKKLESELDKD
jgi:hypothetical protein